MVCIGMVVYPGIPAINRQRKLANLKVVLALLLSEKSPKQLLLSRLPKQCYYRPG
jgi:hypothetical protein